MKDIILFVVILICIVLIETRKEGLAIKKAVGNMPPVTFREDGTVLTSDGTLRYYSPTVNQWVTLPAKTNICENCNHLHN